MTLAESLGLLPDADSGELQKRLLEALLGEDWPDSLRGKLSQANWQALLELQREAQALSSEQADFGELLDFLDRLLLSLAALSGFALDDMTRDDGWRFLMIGRCIERLQFLCDSLANFLRSSAANDQSALEWLLELGNSSITYRTRYLASAQLIPVLDLLLLDEQNPHAVLFQVRTLSRLGERFELPSERRLKHLEGQLARFSLASLENPLFVAASVQEVLDGLSALLESISQASAEISDRLGLRFFVHVDASQRTQSS